jgi:hypothetical protein
MNADDLLLKAKTDVYHRLLGDELLANVPILLDDEGSVDRRAEVDAGTRNTRNAKTGACVIVAAVGVQSLESADTPTPLMNIALEFDVLEDVLINEGPDGTGMNCGEIVARLVQTLHQSHYDDRFTGLRLSPETPVRELITDQPGLRGMTVQFVANGCAFGIIATVASVTASVAAGMATLTCATSGSTIYYTLDGSYPGSGNPVALVYSAPFAVTTGDEIRAGAQKTGMNPSKYLLVSAVSA